MVQAKLFALRRGSSMQIPEWYTGSDDSGRVAAGIERAIERMDDRTADHSDIADLEKLLVSENEINWRNFLLGQGELQLVSFKG